MDFKTLTFHNLWHWFQSNTDRISHAIAFIAIIPFISLGYSSLVLVYNATFYPDTPLGEIAAILRNNPVTLNTWAYWILMFIYGLCAFKRPRIGHIPVFIALTALAPGNLGFDFMGNYSSFINSFLDVNGFLQKLIGDVATFTTYVIACLTIFFGILPRSSLTTNPCLWAIILLVIETIPQIFGLYVPTYDFIFNGYFNSPLNVLTFMSLLIFLRAGVKIFDENRTILADLKKVKKFTNVRNQALSLWAPIGVVFLILMGAGFYWQNQVMRPFLIKQIVDSTPDQAKLRDCEKTKITDESVTAALQVFVSRNNCALQAEFRAITANAKNTADETGDDLHAYGRSKLPRRFPGTKSKKCDLLDEWTKCVATNASKSVLNSGYVLAREAFLRELVTLTNNIGGSITERKARLDNAIAQRFNTLTDNIKLRIYQVGVTLTLIQYFLMIYAVLVLLKSFVIVFARVLYSTVGLGRSAADTSSKKQVPGVIKVHGAQTKLRAGSNKTWYFIFRVLGPNAIDMRRIPQFLTMIFGRMRRGLYIMCRVDGVQAKNAQQVELKVDVPGNIIEWEIKEGEEVYVNLSDLIGFEGSCKLGWKVSFHISSLVFGRIIYFTVTGPGTIYLATRAEALAGQSGKACSIMHATSLVAWSKNCEFNIKSSLKRVDVFFSGYSISKVNRQRFLVAYDKSQTRRLGAGRGLWRTAITFLLPF